MKTTLLLSCTMLASMVHADTIKFKLLNNLKNNSVDIARFVTSGMSTNDLNFSTSLPKNSLTTSEGKRTYETTIDSDQVKQIYFKLSGSPTVYGYEIKPKGYKTVYLRIVDGPVIEPQTSLGRKISDNIEASSISNIGAPAKGTSPYKDDELAMLKLKLAIPLEKDEEKLIALAKEIKGSFATKEGQDLVGASLGKWNLTLYLLSRGGLISDKDRNWVRTYEKRNPGVKLGDSFKQVKYMVLGS